MFTLIELIVGNYQNLQLDTCICFLVAHPGCNKFVWPWDGYWTSQHSV